MGLSPVCTDDSSIHLEGVLDSIPASLRCAEVPDAPPPEFRFRKGIHLGHAIRQLYRARGTIRALTERELRVRYKQAYLGFAWAVFTPAILMIVFTILLSHGVIRVSTGGKPDYLFSYVPLVPWTIFASAATSGSMSLLTNIYLVNRIYCPREVFPLSSVLVALFDGIIASLLLFVLFPIGHTSPAGTSVWLPLLLLIELVYASGVCLLLSVTVVYMRDLRHVIPVIMQFGLFATPVMYTMEKVPAHFRNLYTILNPLGPVIDGFRRAMLYGQDPQWGLVEISAIASMAVLVIGYTAFRRFEMRIADVV